jgi:DNA-directed RNA polymerase subunit RPC12/RpoP
VALKRRLYQHKAELFTGYDLEILARLSGFFIKKLMRKDKVQEQVKCPVCGRRLFDIEGHSTGLIAIKCMHCKQIAKLQLANIYKNKDISIKSKILNPTT